MSSTIVWTIAIGLLIASLARMLDRRVDSLGFIPSALVAIGGALGATYGGHLCGLYRPGQPSGFLAAFVGAVVVLFLVRISEPDSAT